ncbi:MAG TPA: RdgB/HAM1 family non-canonical purine NTP pyrophosphatase [Candidatus Methylomirabilis sp.]|nr:RdgB/HAM1 family non-canonical purine NTP pyrophosphatase [Candidatus Methylomirabilis sp.]
MARRRSSSEAALVLATANRAKARELQALLRDVPYRVLNLTDVPSLALPAEGSTSYTENALLKARAVAVATGMLALADDSGIEVDALDGRPGVLSARYGGDGLSDENRWRLMLAELSGVPPQRRTARYRAVVALCDPAGREATTEGVVEGIILEGPRGSGGFGYDPIFYYPPLQATFAEVTPDAKHAVSHRGQAMTGARRVLLEWTAGD